MTLAALAVSIALAVSAGPTSVEIRIRLPEGTPTADTIYLAGNLPAVGAWKADGFACERTETRAARALLALAAGEILEFKATRGTWETVEKSADGREVANRRLVVEGDASMEIEVEAWADSAPERPSTVTGDVRFHGGFRSALLGNERTLRVYLPPGYSETDARYPVLYMHDGQNLFDEATSFIGAEWGVDETCDRLIREGRIPPIVVVGIDNPGEARADEYTPVPDSMGEGGRRGGGADTYGRFLIEEVKPFVDRTYRTLSDRAHTAVAGSSFGGILSLHLAWTRPEAFAAAGVVSPSLWWGDDFGIRRVEAGSRPDPAPRLWIDMGTEEGEDRSDADSSVAAARRLGDALAAKGLRENEDYAVRIYEDADHSERAWAARLDEILLFLYGRR